MRFHVIVSEVPRLLRNPLHPNHGSVIAFATARACLLLTITLSTTSCACDNLDRPKHRSHDTMISSGFTNAPVTQTLVFGTVIGTLAATITDTRYYLPIAVAPHVWGYGQLWRFITWGWVFTNSTEVLFGVLSFYQLRVVERLWGTRKFLVRITLFSRRDGQKGRTIQNNCMLI